MVGLGTIISRGGRRGSTDKNSLLASEGLFLSTAASRN